MEGVIFLKLKNSTNFKIILTSTLLGLFCVIVTVFFIFKTMGFEVNSFVDNYNKDMMNTFLNFYKKEKEVSRFQREFPHFKLNDKKIAILNFEGTILFKTKRFEKDLITNEEINNLIEEGKKIKNIHFPRNFFLMSENYYLDKKEKLIVFYIDEKDTVFRKTLRLLIMIFFLSIIISFSGFIYLVDSDIKRKISDLNYLLNDLKAAGTKKIEGNLLDKLTGFSSVINQLLEEITIITKEKDSLAQSKISLLSELAHDIRTPLTSIQAASETFFEIKKLGDEEKEKLNNIIQLDINYLSKLIDDLLFLSLLDKKSESKSENLSMNDLLFQLDSKYNVHQKRNISFLFDKEQFKEVVVNELEFLRLMSNLINNSIYSSLTYVKVKIKKDEKFVSILVSNDFKNLDEESIKNYGKKMVKRKIDLKNKNSSLGLGSVIVSTIVKKWLGDLTIDVDKEQSKIEIKVTFPYSY
tara:strand:- start:4724 stop:6124 length:1401 start_codon:yes stop_codon:yes gene_type:complete